MWMTGCGWLGVSDTPEPTTAPTVAIQKADPPRAPMGEQIGAEGPVTGTLAFTDQPPVADAADDAPAMTSVALHLTWDDGAESHDVQLGTYPGPCAPTDAVPVGMPGAERTPLWSLRCGPADADMPTELFLLQVGASLSAIQRVEPSKQFPDKPRFRPVAKVLLANGATLEPGT